jgi:hypothetical protein
MLQYGHQESLRHSGAPRVSCLVPQRISSYETSKFLPMILGSRPEIAGWQTKKFIFGKNTHKFIRTLSETDAGLCKIYWRTGWRFSARTGSSDPKVLDTRRINGWLLLL